MGSASHPIRNWSVVCTVCTVFALLAVPGYYFAVLHTYYNTGTVGEELELSMNQDVVVNGTTPENSEIKWFRYTYSKNRRVLPDLQNKAVILIVCSNSSNVTFYTFSGNHPQNRYLIFHIGSNTASLRSLFPFGLLHTSQKHFLQILTLCSLYAALIRTSAKTLPAIWFLEVVICLV